MVQLLLSYGADPRIEDSRGRIPLQVTRYWCPGAKASQLKAELKAAAAAAAERENSCCADQRASVALTDLQVDRSCQTPSPRMPFRTPVNDLPRGSTPPLPPRVDPGGDSEWSPPARQASGSPASGTAHASPRGAGEASRQPRVRSYRAAGSADITEGEWVRQRAAALRAVKDALQGAAAAGFPTADIASAPPQLALSRVAAALQDRRGSGPPAAACAALRASVPPLRLLLEQDVAAAAGAGAGPVGGRRAGSSSNATRASLLRSAAVVSRTARRSGCVSPTGHLMLEFARREVTGLRRQLQDWQPRRREPLGDRKAVVVQPTGDESDSSDSEESEGGLDGMGDASGGMSALVPYFKVGNELTNRMIGLANGIERSREGIGEVVEGLQTYGCCGGVDWAKQLKAPVPSAAPNGHGDSPTATFSAPPPLSGPPRVRTGRRRDGPVQMLCRRFKELSESPHLLRAKVPVHAASPRGGKAVHADSSGSVTVVTVLLLAFALWAAVEAVSACSLFTPVPMR
eukprot:TRINITY_DN4591_c0_g1_i2.p1 TRINITY_DN4591_c0_g1~~TRINITY_DN4591_c0_g1_i2.p1  ORF type:complete len:517 (+),score=150.71 TRINITY_DN4591_c0_g1_i2:875-2425(+)